jgi:hypothetical protein
MLNRRFQRNNKKFEVKNFEHPYNKEHEKAYHLGHSEDLFLFPIAPI